MCHGDKLSCNDKMENAKVVISKDAYCIIANKVEQFMIMVKAITESKGLFVDYYGNGYLQ